MAEMVKEGITIEFEGNTVKFDNSVGGMNKAIKLLQKDIQKLNRELKLDPGNADKLTQVFKDTQKQIEATKKQIALYKKEIANLTGPNGEYPTGKEQQAEFEKMVKGLADAEEKLVRFEQRAQRLQETLDKLNVKPLSESLREAGESLQKVGSGIETAAKKLAPISAASGGLFAGATKAAMDFESALAGVYKTVEETPTTSYKDIENTIREMAQTLPSTATEIASVMEMAGQLGVKADDLEKFTKVMVDLGNATNINATEGAAAVAQFYNIMQGDLQTVDRFGAAITDLGNNSATTEADILNMAKALAATGFNIKISEQDILGLATALSSVGLKTERGGSSLSQVLKKIDIEVATNGDKLANWAKVAGMSAEDFSNAWKGDTINTIKKVIKGLADTSEEGENLNVVLQDLDVKQIRQNDTMQRLANAYSRVDEYVSLANKAWAENSALTVEVNRRYATTESQMKMVKNQIIELGISLGEAILPVIKEVLETLKPIIESIRNFVRENSQAIASVLGLTATLSPMLFVLGKSVSTFGNVAIGASKMAEVFQTSKTATEGVAKILAGAGTAGLVGAAAAAAIGLGALAVAYYEATNETFQFQRAQENLRKELEQTTTQADVEYQQRQTAIEQSGYYAEKLDRLALAYQATNEAGGDTGNIMEQIHTVIGLLNEGLGGEVFAFDEATGAIMVYGQETQNAKASTEQLIGVMKQQAWLETHQKAWQEAQDKQTEATQAMITATQGYVTKLGEIEYNGAKIPQEVIDNIDQFFTNGVLDADAFKEALGQAFAESGIDISSWTENTEQALGGFERQVREAYQSYKTEIGSANQTLAESAIVLDQYNRVLNAQPGEIEGIIAAIQNQTLFQDQQNLSYEQQITLLENIKKNNQNLSKEAIDQINAQIQAIEVQMGKEQAQATAKDQQIQQNKANAITAEKEIDAEKRMNSQRNSQYEQKAREESDATTRKKTENDNNYTNKVSIPNTITRGETEKRVSNEVATVEQQNSNKTKQVKETNVNAYKKTAKDAETEIANHTNTETQRAAGYIKTNIVNAYSGSFGEAKRQFNQMMAEMDARQLQAKYVDIYERYHPADRSSGVAGSNFNNINTRNEWENQPKSGGFGDINLETKIYVNSNPDIRQVKAWGRQIADVINVELGRLVKA